MVLAIQHFRVYLEGKKFEIVTDCSALSWLEKFKTTKRRLFGWSFELSAYDYTLKHRSGSKNQAADALSRNPVNFLTDYNDYKKEIDTYDIKSKIIEENDIIDNVLGLLYM